MSRRRSKIGTIGCTTITELDAKGRGVGVFRDRPIHVPATLPGEDIRFRISGQRRRAFEGELVDLYRPAGNRVRSHCAHFFSCGGCSFQHLDIEAQRALKMAHLRAQFDAVGVALPPLSPPIVGPDWGYRRSARLAARFVPGKGGMLVGFRERAGNKVVLMDTCPVLDERVQSVLAALGPVLGRLSAPRAVPQIQVAAGEREVALVLRHLEPLTPSDEDLLGRFGDEHRVTWLLQSGGPDTLRPLSGSMMPALSYRHPAFSVELSFDASDFIQINATVNERLVTTAVSWLAPTAGDRVLDAFCGIGNFTLALATRAGEVLGVEGDSTLVNRAQDNAQLNRIANAQFAVANLYDADMAAAVLERPYDAMVIDPPRSGAEAFVQAMTTNPPPRVVYVSCEPTTLARDADYLVNTLGYRVGRAGIADMFPHTNHVESVVLFLK